MANKYLKRCPSDWQKLEGQQYLLLEEKRVYINKHTIQRVITDCDKFNGRKNWVLWEKITGESDVKWVGGCDQGAPSEEVSWRQKVLGRQSQAEVVHGGKSLLSSWNLRNMHCGQSRERDGQKAWQGHRRTPRVWIFVLSSVRVLQRALHRAWRDVICWKISSCCVENPSEVVARDPVRHSVRVVPGWWQ